MEKIKFLYEKNKQIALICLVCLFVLLYLKTSTDPVSQLIKNTPAEIWFYQFEEGNSLLNNISLGILISTIFWFFNVYLPERKVKKAKLERLGKALMLIVEAKNGNPFGWDKHYIYCNPLNEKHKNILMGIRTKIATGEIDNSLEEKAFYEICEASYELFTFLSIAANEISPNRGELWDSMTRNITQIGKFYPIFHKRKIESGWKLGDKRKDFSGGLFELNMIELLNKMEKWIEMK